MAVSLSQFQPRDFENVCGGLRTRIVPNRLVKKRALDQEELDQESQCLTIHEFEKWHWEFEDDRRHYRLLYAEFLNFFPAFYADPIFNNKLTQYDWSIYCNLHQPDPKYVCDLNQAIISHLKMSNYHCMNEGFCSQMDNFSISEKLFNIKWLQPNPRRDFFIYIAKLLRNQTDLKNVILENCHLRHEEGLRLLLTLSLTVGKTLERLYLWHFFIKGVMPLNIGYKEDMADPYLMTKDLKSRVPEDEKERIWNEYLMDEVGYDLPHYEFHFFTIFLKSFTNLSVLYVQYTWVALGQGIGLNLLKCIKNGNLKHLYLLCTREDMPYNSGCRVAPIAWLKARLKCPQLNVHLIVMHVGDSYDDNLTLLQDQMPLTSYLLCGGLPIIDYHKVKEAWFDCLIRTIIHKYNSTLRRLHLEVWYPRVRVDVMLAKCLTDLPLLESFTYCGPFDKIDSIKEMCEFLLNYETKLKFLKLLILEDPCAPNQYQVVAKQLEEDYKLALNDRSIIFIIGTQII